MEIQLINIDEIIPYENNAKLHPKEQIEQIKKSILEFGNNDPIAIDKDNIIIEGHGRLLALKELGYKEVEVIKLGHLTEEQRKAYTLIHNKLTMNTDFDLDILMSELEDINFIDMSEFDFEIEFDDIDIESVEEEDNYEVELPEQPKAKLGDIYQLGNHRLMCGDSTSIDDVKKLIDGELIDMCFTDPPYNVSIGTIKHPKFKQREIENDNMSKEDFKVFCKKFILNIKQFVRGCVYMCAGQGEDGRVMFTIADELLHCSTTIIWNKDQFTLGRGKYQNRYEPIWFGWVENGTDFTEDRTLENVWDIPRPKKSELHPTMKPLEIMITAMKHNPKSKSVLDLFGGSGSTLIACEQLNRKCYMMELDPKYVDVIIDRWETLTGNKAVLLNEYI